MPTRRIAILPSVLQVVMAAPSEVRHEFWRVHQRLEDALDLRSWDELATLPARDPGSLPEDSWIVALGAGGWVTYVISEDDSKKDAEIIGVELP